MAVPTVAVAKSCAVLCLVATQDSAAGDTLAAKSLTHYPVLCLAVLLPAVVWMRMPNRPHHRPNSLPCPGFLLEQGLAIS